MEANEILDRLRDEVERGDSWMPSEHDDHPNPLTGEVVGWDTGKSKDGTQECEILLVRDTRGKTWAVWTWHTYLRIQLIGDKGGVHPVEERPAQPGNFIAIRWVGKGPRQDGDGEVHRYKTAIEATDTEPGERPAFVSDDTDIPFT